MSISSSGHANKGMGGERSYYRHQSLDLNISGADASLTLEYEKTLFFNMTPIKFPDVFGEMHQ